MEFGAEINAVDKKGATPLYLAMFYGKLGSFDELVKFGAKLTGCLSTTLIRDKHKMLQHLIEKQQYLSEAGYKKLIIDKVNFHNLFNTCLEKQSWKCLLVLLTHNKTHAHSPINLNLIIARALTV